MYDKITLENGVRIVSERISHVRSASIGIWIGVGSRDERPAENGAAHFVEHMLFKGTPSRSAEVLAAEMDAIGGQVNAFTTKEYTCLYARVPDYHLDSAIGILSDMFFNSKFAEEDVAAERGVILEEIDMCEDTPEDIVTDRLFARTFRGALGRPVLGRPATLGTMTGESLKAFKNERYTGSRVVVSICGNYKRTHLNRLAGLFKQLPLSAGIQPQKGSYTPAVLTKRKATEQNHIVLAYPGLPLGDEHRYSLQLLSNMLGGGMSSRLFQTVREKHGLCYSIYSFLASFRDAGLLGIATALGRETELKALSLIRDEINRVLDDGFSEDELIRNREQVKAGLALSMESTSARMNALGSGEITLGKSLSPDEVMERYDSVTGDGLLDLSRKLFNPNNLSFSAVGRVSAADDYLNILKP